MHAAACPNLALDIRAYFLNYRTMSTDSHPINLDFDIIKDIAYRGVRRTACFLAFGLNSVNASDFGNYNLRDFSFYEFLTRSENKEDTIIAVEEYRIWILQSGFRDLIESFSIFIDRVFAACYIISHSNNLIDMNELDRDYKKFTKQSIADRLFRLKTEFQVSCTHEDAIISIYKARNCFTHRQGIVGTTDAGDDSSFAVHWVAIDGFTVDSSGVRTPVPIAQNEPFLWKKDHTLLLEQANRSRMFAVGERLLFDANEVTEVCYFTLLCADELIANAIAFAKVKGIQVQEPTQTQGPI